jgi:endonuclease/exonuclease/phosphatase family metal-dependent hydrolase
VTDVRVGTWNLHGLRAGVDAALREVRRQELDVLLVQESGSRKDGRALGERLGWVACLDPPAFPRRRVRNAVLLRPGLVRSVRSRLERLSPGSFLAPRGALLAELDERWAVTSVHLGLDAQERGRHVRQLLGLRGVTGERSVLGGDLNAEPDAPGPAAVRRHLTDVWEEVGAGPGATFPARAPTARIDYVFVGAAVRALRAWTAGSPEISDHLMVVADLRVPDA